MGTLSLANIAPFVESFNCARSAAVDILQVIERKSKLDPLSQDGLRPTTVTGHLGK
jgi:hypothetical protein